MLTTTLPVTQDAPQWSVAKRFGFGLAFTYLVLYHLEAFLGLLIPVFRITGSPGNLGPRAMYRLPWDRLAAWIGIHVFSVDPALLVSVNGSIDSAIHYARTGCFLLAAIITAILWTIADRRREYVGLNQWLTDFLRFALAIDLFFYGVNKVIPVQMLPGHLFTTDLIQPFGEKSPAGLLWAFVGYSVPYQMLSGAVELLGALLLLTRRTVALGALVCLVATVNVVLLNFCYDVDLKLYTSNLLAAAIFLAWPVLSTVVRLFVFRQPVTPPPLTRSSRTGWAWTTARIAFAVFLAVDAYQTVAGAYAELTFQAGLPTATPLYGIYEVETFRRNGQEIPPLTTDRRRWRRVVMEAPQVVRVQLMDDSFERYRVAYNQGAMQLTVFTSGAKSDPGNVFSWSAPDADHVELNGRVGGDTVVLSLRRIDRSKFLLMDRGFHWMQRESLIE